MSLINNQGDTDEIYLYAKISTWNKISILKVESLLKPESLVKKIGLLRGELSFATDLDCFLKKLLNRFTFSKEILQFMNPLFAIKYCIKGTLELLGNVSKTDK